MHAYTWVEGVIERMKFLNIAHFGHCSKVFHTRLLLKDLGSVCLLPVSNNGKFLRPCTSEVH